jgi:hypothetical protein
VNGGALLRDTLLKGLRDGCCFTYNRNEDQRVMQDDEKECQKGSTRNHTIQRLVEPNATLREVYHPILFSSLLQLSDLHRRTLT